MSSDGSLQRIISLNVNGQGRTCAAAPGTPLAYLLRNDLGLTGTKFACGLEQCGALQGAGGRRGGAVVPTAGL